MKYKKNTKFKFGLIHIAILVLLIITGFLAINYNEDIKGIFASEDDGISDAVLADTVNKIVKLKSGIVKNAYGNEYTWDLYRHTTHTCAKSGYQTFLFIYPKGSNLKSSTPLIVRYHGGGAGFFGNDGTYNGSGWINQENEDTLLSFFNETGVMRYIQNEQPSTRFLITSMCDHDYSVGNGSLPDPNNPNNPDENGNKRTADGLTANIKAIIFVTKISAISKFVVYGTSAGAYGAFYTGIRIQENNPTNSSLAGIVMDSGISDWNSWKIIKDYTENTGEYCGAIQEYVQPRLGFYGIDKMSVPSAFKQSVTKGSWKVPVYLIWDEKDKYGCGHKTVTYEDSLGQTISSGGTEIIYRPFTDLIERINPGGKSKVAKLCVVHHSVEECTIHVPTQKNLIDKYQITGSGNYSKNIADWIVSLF